MTGDSDQRPWKDRPAYWVGYLDALRFARFEAESADDLDALLYRLKRRRDDIVGTYEEQR